MARLDDAIDELQAELRRRGRAPATLKRAREKLGHFPRLWGRDCMLADIDAKRIAQYIDARLLEGGVSRGTTVKRITIRDELAFLRQTLKLARRHGLYPHAIDDVMPLLFETGHKPRKDFIPFDRLICLLLRLPAVRVSHVLFFCVTGGRTADSLRARRQDFDLERWRITVHGSKTDGSLRTIPVPEFLRPYVRQLVADAPGDDLLFMSWGKLLRDLAAACRRAGVPVVSTNGLRRTFGHALRTHGYDLDTISKLFGHTTAKLVRDVYADVEGDELAAVVAAQGRTKTVQRSATQGRNTDEIH